MIEHCHQLNLPTSSWKPPVLCWILGNDGNSSCSKIIICICSFYLLMTFSCFTEACCQSTALALLIHMQEWFFYELCLSTQCVFGDSSMQMQLVLRKTKIFNIKETITFLYSMSYLVCHLRVWSYWESAIHCDRKLIFLLKIILYHRAACTFSM